MTQKIECDMCCKIVDRDDSTNVRFYDGFWNGECDYELCKECNNKFRVFFKDVKNKIRVKK